jgi:hypothetical protein
MEGARLHTERLSHPNVRRADKRRNQAAKDRYIAQKEAFSAQADLCHVCGRPSLYKFCMPGQKVNKGACAAHRATLRTY